MKRKAFLYSLTGVTCALGFMMTVQIESRPSRGNTGSSYLDLRSEIQDQAQEHKTLLDTISRQTVQLSQYQASEGNDALMHRALNHDAEVIAEQAGLTPVRGAGLTITIKDDPNLPYVQDYAGMWMTQGAEELSLIVNDLFANGATAISINGQRLTTTSTIRMVTSVDGEETIQVNAYPLNPNGPYVISAVGDSDLMQNVLAASEVTTLLQMWQMDCVVKVKNASHPVTIPAYHGPLPGTWAKEVKTQ